MKNRVAPYLEPLDKRKAADKSTSPTGPGGLDDLQESLAKSGSLLPLGLRDIWQIEQAARDDGYDAGWRERDRLAAGGALVLGFVSGLTTGVYVISLVWWVW